MADPIKKLGYTIREAAEASSLGQTSVYQANPYRGDIVGRIFEDMLSGSLKREDVRSRVNAYIAEFNRLYPTKYAKFGDSQLVSLDEVLFGSGSTTRGDSVSRGLWD